MTPCSKEKEIDKIHENLEKQVELEITREGRLVRIEEKQDAMAEKIDILNTTVKEFIAGADKKYAPYWVAGLVIFLISGVGLYIIQAFLRNAGLK